MQNLELPALVGVLEEAVRLVAVAVLRGVPAATFQPGDLPHCSGTRGRTCRAAGMCRRDTAEFPAVTQAEEQVGQEELKTLWDTGRGERW